MCSRLWLTRAPLERFSPEDVAEYIFKNLGYKTSQQNLAKFVDEGLDGETIIMALNEGALPNVLFDAGFNKKDVQNMTIILRGKQQETEETRQARKMMSATLY